MYGNHFPGMLNMPMPAPAIGQNPQMGGPAPTMQQGAPGVINPQMYAAMRAMGPGMGQSFMQGQGQQPMPIGASQNAMGGNVNYPMAGMGGMGMGGLPRPMSDFGSLAPMLQKLMMGGR